MKPTQPSLRRLILGMSVEDAQSKFDTAESRLRVRLAHEHHNQHVLHELHRAQKARNVLPAERKCHISRFAKPSVAGFQAVVKESPDDYYVEELWEPEATTAAAGEATKDGERAPAEAEGLAANQMALEEDEEDASLDLHRHLVVTPPPPTVEGDDGAAAAAAASRTALVPYAKVQEEVEAFQQQRRCVVQALQESLDIVADNVLRELRARRSSGSLVTGQQKSLIDQLVDKNKEATQKNYKRVSSSSHLLDSVEMTLNLYNRKDKDVAEAFRSPALFIPAREASVSFSLWVSGGLLARDQLCDEFPCHIAKYVVDTELQQQQQQLQQQGGGGGGGAAAAHVIPRLIVEVYFSPELYLLSSLVGIEGIVALRQYVGAVMRQQHEPVPTSASLLLNTLQAEQEQLFHPHSYLVTGSSSEKDRSVAVPTHIQIPWRDARLGSNTNNNNNTNTTSPAGGPTRAKITGTVLDHNSNNNNNNNSNADSATISIDKMKEGIQYVWKTWGHLVKDLHVYADLDFLYVSIDRAKEMKENNDYMNEVKTLDAKLRAEGELPSPQTTSNHYEAKGSTSLISTPTAAASAAQHYLNSGAGAQAGGSHVVYVPLSADFTVIECTLERKGLHHNMVLEDITQTLTEMQNQSLEAARLAFIDEMENYVATLAEEAEEAAAAAEAAALARSKKKGKQKAAAAAAARRNIPPPLTLSSIVPVIYAPKVVVSHAGTIENGTHSFQKIRIRGSSLAHVESLCRALQQEQYFTSWDGSGGLPPQLSERGAATAPTLALPPNLSFVNSHHSRAYLASMAGGNHNEAEDAFRSATAAAAGRTTSLSVRERLLRGQRAFSPATSTSDSSNSNTLNKNNASGNRNAKNAGTSFDEYAITAEEREFWRANYYKLTQPKLLLHDRVDAADALVAQQHHHNSKALRDTVSARLREHLRVVNSRLQTEEQEQQQQQQQGGEKSSTAAATTRRATVDLQRIAPEKMYEYLCTDCEAETAMWDLRVGDHKGYFYKLNLTHIPSKDMKKQVPQALQSVQRKGFINYFGPERFGSYTKLNMHPGLHLLKGDFRAAAHIIVQQFYLDAALRAQQLLQSNFTPTAAMLPRLADFPVLGSGGAQPHHLFYQPFGNAHHSGKRNVAEDGTALQRVLNNALQASLLMGEARASVGGSGGNRASSPLDDPCAEAFLSVIGPNACRVLIHEFLSFVWNDIVNQRLQRYGTYCVLPGDLVRRKSLRSSPSFNYSAALADSSRQTIDITEIFQDPHELTFVRQRDIDERLYTPFDVLLPLPGAAMLLPQNHTADLYVITLRRYGLVFNPEERQWNCFYPRQTDNEAAARHRRGAAASPYHNLTSSFSIMEEDLASATSYDESYTTAPKVFSKESYRASGAAGGSKADAKKKAQAELLVDATAWRADLRREGGNACDLWIHANYRAPLMNPSAQDVSLRSVLPVRSSLYNAAIAAASASSAATPESPANEAGIPVFSFVESSDGTSSNHNSAAFTAAANNNDARKNVNANLYKEAQSKINALKSPFQRWGASRRLSQECFTSASLATQLRQNRRHDADEDGDDEDDTITSATSTSSIIDTEGMLEIEEINKNAHRLHKPSNRHKQSSNSNSLNQNDTIDTEGPDYDYADVESNPFALPNGEELITGRSQNSNSNSSSSRMQKEAAARQANTSSLLVYESPRQQKGRHYKMLPLPRPSTATTTNAAAAAATALSTTALRDITAHNSSTMKNNNITNIIPYWRYESLCEPHAVQLQFQLPSGTYSSMLLREVTKMDVNYADRDVLLASRQREQQQQQQQAQLMQQQEARQRQQQQYVAKRRSQRLLFDRRPRALSTGLLHQSVFRSEGIRQSLLPTLRSYDSVAK